MEPPNPTGPPHSHRSPPVFPAPTHHSRCPPFPIPPPLFLTPTPVPNFCEQTHHSPAPSPGIWGALEFSRGRAGKRLPPTLCMVFGSELGCFAIFRLFFPYFVPAPHSPWRWNVPPPLQGGFWPPQNEPPHDPPSFGGRGKFPPSPRGFHPKTALGGMGSCLGGPSYLGGGRGAWGVLGE